MTEHDHPAVATATFEEAPCRCVRTHVPKPARVEKHHPYPQAAQIERYGKVVDNRTVPLCNTAHDNVHYAISRILKGDDFRLGNRYQQALAEEGVRKIREGA